MRRRAWTAWACLASGIAAGLLGRTLPAADTWNLAAGLLFLAAVALALTLLPIGRRLVPGLADMPDLFDRPGRGERWCAGCGHPTPRAGPCRTCGSAPPAPRRARARLHAK